MRTPGRTAAVAGLTALVLAGGVSSVSAQSWQGWSAYWENDSFVLFGGSDDAFTNGVKLTVNRHPNAGANPWIDWLENWFGGHTPFGQGDSDSTTSVAIGQNFFTPRVITDYDRDPTDRPYAGLAYVGLRADITERPRLVDSDNPEIDDPVLAPRQSRSQQSLELNLGVIGPWAGADAVQSSVHAALRTHRIPKGWTHQFDNSLAVSALYSFRHLWRWKYLEVVPHFGGMVGTTQIYPYAGGTVRLGVNSSGFPSSIVRNTAVGVDGREDWELGIFGGLEGRYFLFNSFVEGPIWGGEGISPERAAGDYRFGFWLRLRDWRLNYTFLRRSPEVAEPGPSEGLFDNYGSLSFSYEPATSLYESGFAYCLVECVFATLLEDFILEASVGADLLDGREEGVDGTHGMHVAVGRALWGKLSDFDVAYELVGVGREFGPPPIPDRDHSDRFLVNSLFTVRWRPWGGRLGPGDAHIRAGVGSGKVKFEVTPGVPGDRAGPCPTGTSFEPPDLRYCTTSESGTGYMLGAGYSLSWGRSLGFNTDIAWNVIDLMQERRFLALTWGLRWAPR